MDKKDYHIGDLVEFKFNPYGNNPKFNIIDYGIVENLSFNHKGELKVFCRWKKTIKEAFNTSIYDYFGFRTDKNNRIKIIKKKAFINKVII